MFGFTYNGVHSSEFGLYYTQSAEDKWFVDPEYEVYSEEIGWKNGGYYYGSSVKIRKFTIQCYFEEIDIATRQRIKQWVKYGTYGTLIFDDKPFVYWNVRPGKVPVGKWYLDSNESHSGTVTITFVAYEPFGYLTRKSNSANLPDDGAEDYCNIINSDEMPEAPSTSKNAFDIYNPGTEDCGLSIEISGTTSNPIRFINNQNSTFCEFSSLPSGNLHVRIDGDTGYVSTLIGGASSGENGYAYHEKGVVKLSPNVGFSNIQFVYNGLNGTTYTFTLNGVNVGNDYVGGIITISGLDNTSFTVMGINRSNNRIYCSRTGSGTPASAGVCSMKTVNHISIQEKSNNSWVAPSTLSLSYISVDYNPRLL